MQRLLALQGERGAQHEIQELRLEGARIGAGLAKAALAGRVGRGDAARLVDTSYRIEADSALAIVTEKDADGLDVIRHSTAHLLAYAVKELFPDAQVTIGPTIEDGFYYDFSYKRPFTPEDLEAIEKKMAELAKKDEKVERKVLPRDEAVAYFKGLGENYKAEIIESIPADQDVSLYSEGAFTDLCRGPHVPSTGKLKHFKLMKVAGAYWRGDHRNEMLQRVYGTAWASKDDLQKYLTMLEEAEKRDHRRLATQLDLFHMEEDAPGMVFWHPKGWTLWQQVEQYMRRVYRDNGYQEVRGPTVLPRSLWETTGHWENYRENMFTTESEKRDYALKPMNCPGHIQIYNANLHSYRELPLRYGEFGACHRNEPSGSLHGMMRVRGFTQDDAHVFCLPDQISDEILAILNLTEQILSTFDFRHYEINLSTRPEKSIGDDAVWELATKGLIEALDRKGWAYKIDEGGGAFYGPKIDLKIEDAIGRLWQCSTVQLDFNLPERFGLEYQAADGTRQRPVMIHRALFGSMERFFAVLLEHYAGAFPTWLSPVQVKVLPVANAHSGYAASVVASLRSNGFRAEIVDSDEQLGKRIRTAKVDKVPYVLVVGDDDVAGGTVGVNPRGGDVERGVTVDAFIRRIAADVAEGLTGGE